jgi:hypothetical protein
MSEPNHKAVAVINKGEIVPQVHPMVVLQQAIERGIDPDALKKLMDLVERHESMEAKKAYDAAMVDLKRDLPTVLDRDKTVSFKSVHYTHTSLAHAVEIVTPVLTQHGFSVSWVPSNDAQAVAVTCRLTHRQGHFGESTIKSAPDNSGMKSGPQAIASTITLLERYTLLALLGIATTDMPEPEPQAEPNEQNTERTMKAIKAMGDIGISKGDAEAKVGKPADQWNNADLDALMEWYKEKRGEKKGGKDA